MGRSNLALIRCAVEFISVGIDSMDGRTYRRRSSMYRRCQLWKPTTLGGSPDISPKNTCSKPHESLRLNGVKCKRLQVS